MAQVKIFISHSHYDEELARKLINLLRLSLNLSNQEIRCTSVAGYKLPAGSEIAAQLKAEVFDAQVLLALVTPFALKSTYFLFELGARWGTGKSTFPLFARGAEPSSANDWLRAFHGINCESQEELLQLTNDIANKLVQQVASANSYLREVDEIVSTSKQLKETYTEEYGHLDTIVQRQKEQEMVAEDGTLGQVFSDFWNAVNRYFVDVFRPREGVDCPSSLEGLIFAVGYPPNATTPGTDLITWFSRNERRLSEDQRRIWRLVTAIYPPRDASLTGDVWEHSAIRPPETAKTFHQARRSLAVHFAKWPPQVGMEFIHTRFGSRRGYITLLAWLELALVQWTRQEGRGKQPLFKLAEYMNKSATI